MSLWDSNPGLLGSMRVKQTRSTTQPRCPSAIELLLYNCTSAFCKIKTKKLKCETNDYIKPKKKSENEKITSERKIS